MNKLSKESNTTLRLAELSTWQSGILQSSMQRSIKHFTDSYLKQYGLTTMHWLIIGAIYESGDNGIRITDLAKKLGTTLAYLTNAVNVLEAKEIVVRNSHRSDSRTKLLTINLSYNQKCQDIESGLRDIFREKIYSRITREELENYITVMQKLSDLK